MRIHEVVFTATLGCMLTLLTLLPACTADDAGRDARIADTSAPDSVPPDTSTPDTAPPDTMLPDARPANLLTFFVFGDTRSGPDTFKTTLSSMVSLDPKATALLNTGDLTYDGAEARWQLHMANLKQAGKGIIRADLADWKQGYIRYLAAVGNHDVANNSWHDNWKKHLSGQQGLGHNSNKGVYYSVTFGNVLVVVLDSEHTSTDQTTWLQTTLESSAAKAATWRFAVFHSPVYPCNNKIPFSAGVPWVRLFEKHKVDIVFVGHAHTYERTCAMVGGACKAGGVIYLTTGGGGAGTYEVDATKEGKPGGFDPYHCSKKGSEPGILSAAVSYWHHYCHVAIDGKKLTLKAYPHDSTTKPKDSFTISH